MDLKCVQLVGVDLDGTFLRDDKTISPQAHEVISRLYDRGIHFVPITGRPFNGIPDCIKGIPQIEYVISSNGAQIIEMKTGESLYSYSISNEKSREIIDVLQVGDCMFEAFADNVGYVEKQVYDYYEMKYKNTVLWDYIYSSRKLTDSVSALFDNPNRQADEFFITCKSNSARDNMLKSVLEIDGIQVCCLSDCFLEITRVDTDKGNALTALCEHLGINIRNTIVFGDGENDVQLLERAGVAVAMENAFDCIKEKADIITGSNNDDGVLEILKKILI